MEQIINLGIPHIGEQIFESLHTSELLQCLLVTKAWKTLALNILQKRLDVCYYNCESLWKEEIVEVSKIGQVDIVKVSVDMKQPDDGIWACKNLDKLYNLDPYTTSNNDLDIALYIIDHRHDNKIVPLNDCWPNAFCGETAFKWACKNGHEDVVNLVLKHSIKEKHLEINHNGFFFSDPWRSDHSREASGLISSGFKDACKYGHKDVVKLLLDHANIKPSGENYPNMYILHPDDLSRGTEFDWPEMKKILKNYCKEKNIKIPEELKEKSKARVWWSKVKATFSLN